MEFDKHNNSIFTQGIIWEIRFKQPEEISQEQTKIQSVLDENNLYIPSPENHTSKQLYLSAENEEDAHQFLQQFQDACDLVKQDYINEAEHLVENPDLSMEQCQEKAKKVNNSLETLNNLVEKFKDLMKRLKQDEDQVW